jgi:hypothetical protein
MGYEIYRGADHKEWAAAGLDAIMQAHEMTYINQEEDGFDHLRGEWFIADDATRTIIYGTFGNYNSPGASHYTYADVYDDETEYREELAHWASKDEYLPCDEEDEGEDKDEEAPEEDAITTEDHRTFRQYGKVILTVGEGENHWAALDAWMEANGHFPDVWFISDHGNAHLMARD